MRTVAFCEIESYCQKVLRRHWQIPIYSDVRELTGARLQEDGVERPDVICGGFPCQNISVAQQGGVGRGLEGDESSLWFEFARLIAELRPQYVIVENVSALSTRGMDRVLGSLAEIGYDAEWDDFPASFVGAPHERSRLWIVAYPHTVGWKAPILLFEGGSIARWRRQGRQANEVQRQGRGSEDYSENPWGTEPEMARVVDGVPDQLDRIKALGNALVPQIAHMIGEAIMNSP